MRKLIESALVSLDGVIEAPERWANFDEEDRRCPWSSSVSTTRSSWVE